MSDFHIHKEPSQEKSLLFHSIDTFFASSGSMKDEV